MQLLRQNRCARCNGTAVIKFGLRNWKTRRRPDAANGIPSLPGLWQGLGHCTRSFFVEIFRRRARSLAVSNVMGRKLSYSLSLLSLWKTLKISRKNLTHF